MIAAPVLSSEIATPWLVHLVASPPFGIQWGPFGVALFFLVSGFVIPFSIQRYSAGGFAIARLLRIVPPYLCGFAITVTAIYLSATAYGLPFPHSARDVLIHAALLRDFFGHYSIDSIVWTLEVVLKFYLVCVLIAPWLRRASPLLFLAPLACALFAAITDPSSLWRPLVTVWLASHYIIFMFIGVALHFYHQRRMTMEQTVFAAASLLALFVATAYNGKLGLAPNVPSYLAALIVFVAAMAFPAALPDRGPLKFFAEISYSLYVVHGVAGYIILTCLLTRGVPVFVSVALTFISAVTTARVLYLFVESPSQSLGRQVASMRSHSAAAAVVHPFDELQKVGPRIRS